MEQLNLFGNNDISQLEELEIGEVVVLDNVFVAYVKVDQGWPAYGRRVYEYKGREIKGIAYGAKSVISAIYERKEVQGICLNEW